MSNPIYIAPKPNGEELSYAAKTFLMAFPILAANGEWAYPVVEKDIYEWFEKVGLKGETPRPPTEYELAYIKSLCSGGSSKE